LTPTSRFGKGNVLFLAFALTLPNLPIVIGTSSSITKPASKLISSSVAPPALTIRTLSPDPLFLPVRDELALEEE